MSFNELDEIIADRLKAKLNRETSDSYLEYRYHGIDIPTIVARLWKLEKKYNWTDFHPETNTPSTEILLGLQSARQSSKVPEDLKALAKLMFTSLNDLKKSKTLDRLLEEFDIIHLDTGSQDGN